MTSHLLWILAAGTCSLAMASCSSSNNGSTDGGSTDVKSTDAGSKDGSHVGDAGSKDATGADHKAGQPDSGQKDATPTEGGGCKTTLDVTVKDPSGRYSLPNVAVYISTGSIPTIKPGAGNCPTLPTTGVFMTGADGTVPVPVPTSLGGTAELVVQIGKWRTVAPALPATPCMATPVEIALPSKASGSDTVPSIAVSTGLADTLECTLHRMLIDGAVTVFQGAGGAKATTSASSPAKLWDTPGDLSAYDVVLLSCEGAETTGALPTNLDTYAKTGGMVFAEHWQYSWFNAAPFTTENIATWTKGANFLTGTANAVIETTVPGTALTKWITPLGVLVAGELPMANTEAAHNATLGSASTLVIAADATASTPNAPLLFSWSEGTAGRIVYADFHVGSSTGDYGTAVGSTSVPAGAMYPSGCATEGALKPSEVVFLYTLFEDLSCGL
jgi:hypothetical protein